MTRKAKPLAPCSERYDISITVEVWAESKTEAVAIIESRLCTSHPEVDKGMSRYVHIKKLAVDFLGFVPEKKVTV